MNLIKSLLILTVLALIAPKFIFGQGCEGGGSSEGVNVKGFIQPQFNYYFLGEDADGNSLNENSFTFNRARIGFLGSIPYDVSYYFFIETSAFKSAGGAPYLLDAFVTYSRFAPYAKISIGSFKSPFSLEQNTSCSALHTINRTKVVGQLAGPQRDMGVMISGGADTSLVKYSIAFLNGSGLGIYDDNTGKDFAGRVVISPLDFVKVGGSFGYGKTNPTNPDSALNDKLRFAGELQVKYGNFLMQGEYIYGADELFSTSKIPIYGG